MAESLRLDRRQQQLEELSAASLRALAHDPSLSWRQYTLYRGERPVPTHAPHLRIAPAERDLAALRGIGDAHALRLRYSDRALFRKTCPQDPVAHLVYELLEQLRTETLAPAELPGMTSNVRARFLAWSRGFHHSGLTDTALGILIYTVAQMVWSRLNAVPVLPETEDEIEVTRAGIAGLIGPALAGLRRYRHEQARFAPYACELACLVAATIHGSRDDSEETDDDDAVADVRNAFALLLDFDEEDNGPPARAATGQSRVFGDSGGVYRVFTRQFDVEIRAADQVRADQLRDYRLELDSRVVEQGVNRTRLLRLLIAALGTPQTDGRLDGAEEGVIDGRRLARLVSSPLDRRVFTTERPVRRVPCALSFLIDCSGSMKEHSRPVAILVDVFVRALESLGVTTEVLGFTTGAWNGGRAYREWLRRGRPPFPGRLNEVCHRIFKPAERSWRQERAGIAALFKPDLFREGVDGEAVEWAASRLAARDEPRRILMVISDGCPMDGATKLTNDTYYLDNHLRQVVGKLEQSAELEIMGIGVGLDLSPFYRRNVAIDVEGGLDNNAFYDVARLLQRRR